MKPGFQQLLFELEQIRIETGDEISAHGDMFTAAADEKADQELLDGAFIALLNTDEATVKNNCDALISSLGSSLINKNLARVSKIALPPPKP